MGYNKTKTYKTENRHIKTNCINVDDLLNLIKDFSITKNNDLCKKYNIKNTFLNRVKNYYELEKDEEFIKQTKKDVLTHRNKTILGRDLSDDSLKEIALKYNSKTEFYNKDNSAYITARKRGILKDITKHMVKKIISTPELILENIFKNLFKVSFSKNNRSIIKPYEIDLFFDDYNLGIEYNGKRWHENDNVDKIKLCENIGIKLIVIKENNRKYWSDIKNQIILNIHDINKYLKTTVTEQDVINLKEEINYPKLFTEEELHILRNNSVNYLTKNYNNLYNKYKRYNPDNKTFSVIKYTEDYVINEISKYKSIRDIYKVDVNLYQVIHRRFNHLVKKDDKNIICLTDNKEFNNSMDASIHYNIPKKYIDRVLNGKRNKVSNLVFKFL